MTVKKYVSIILLFFYVFSMTEVHQLLKAPKLVEHFLEHKNENNRTTLISFLEVHYLNGFTKDADFEKDMKLPFKASQDNCFNFVVVLPTPEKFELNHEFSLPEMHKPTILHKNQVFISSYLSAIWQPPKIA